MPSLDFCVLCSDFRLRHVDNQVAYSSSYMQVGLAKPKPNPTRLVTIAILSSMPEERNRLKEDEMRKRQRHLDGIYMLISTMLALNTAPTFPSCPVWRQIVGESNVSHCFMVVIDYESAGPHRGRSATRLYSVLSVSHLSLVSFLSFSRPIITISTTTFIYSSCHFSTLLSGTARLASKADLHWLRL